MRSSLIPFLAILGLSQALLAPLHQAKKEDRIEGEYIVILQDGVDIDNAIERFSSVMLLQGLSMGDIKHRYTTAVRGFATHLSSRAVELVRKFENVRYVEEAQIVKAMEVESWGIDRVDQRTPDLDNDYTVTHYGTGATVYVIDTGIVPDHVDFEARASIGGDFRGGDGVDCNGHGTHCAGTVGGYSYGVAKDVDLVGLRVLSCLGFGSSTDIIAAMDWTAENAILPAVASMSLGGGPSPTEDEAIATMLSNGVITAVAAGNSDEDACLTSPSRAPPAMTVGATDINDVRASFSNFGPCVDIWAPGVGITSAWIGSNDSINTISGTSMACPHVAGATAVRYAEAYVPSEKPKEIETLAKAVISAVYDDATKDCVLLDDYASPNRLLYVH